MTTRLPSTNPAADTPSPSTTTGTTQPETAGSSGLGSTRSRKEIIGVPAGVRRRAGDAVSVPINSTRFFQAPALS